MCFVTCVWCVAGPWARKVLAPFNRVIRPLWNKGNGALQKAIDALPPGIAACFDLKTSKWLKLLINECHRIPSLPPRLLLAHRRVGHEWLLVYFRAHIIVSVHAF